MIQPAVFAGRRFRVVVVAALLVAALAGCTSGSGGWTGSVSGRDPLVEAALAGFDPDELASPQDAVSAFVEAFRSGDFVTAKRVVDPRVRQLWMLRAHEVGAVAAVAGFDPDELASPQDAVSAFVEAFRSGDFVTAQREVDPRVRRFWMVRAHGVEAVAAAVETAIVTSSPWQFDAFEALYFAATVNEALLVDLTGGLTDLVMGPGETTSELAPLGGHAAWGTATLAATGEPVTVVATSHEGQAWRVAHLGVGDSSDVAEYASAGLLFSGPSGGRSSPVAPDQLVLYQARLPSTSAVEAAATTVELFEHRNWLGLSVMLHRDAARAVWRTLTNLRVGSLVTPAGVTQFSDFFDLQLDQSMGSFDSDSGWLETVFGAVDPASGLRVDLAGGSVSGDPVALGDHDGQPLWSVPVSVAGRSGYRVDLVEVAADDFRVLAVIGPGSDEPDYSTPFWGSGPFEVPDGAFACADGIVRYDCEYGGRDLLPQQDDLEAIWRQIEELRSRAEADPANAAAIAAEIAVISALEASPSQGGWVNGWALCASLQGAPHDWLDAGEPFDAASLVESFAAKVCPGDVDLVLP